MPYATTGLGYCNINVTQPGTYTVTFSVSPSGSFADPLQATVRRTVIVTSSCPEGEAECNGSCGEHHSFTFASKDPSDQSLSFFLQLPFALLAPLRPL